MSCGQSHNRTSPPVRGRSQVLDSRELGLGGPVPRRSRREVRGDAPTETETGARQTGPESRWCAGRGQAASGRSDPCRHRHVRVGVRAVLSRSGNEQAPSPPARCASLPGLSPGPSTPWKAPSSSEVPSGASPPESPPAGQTCRRLALRSPRAPPHEKRHLVGSATCCRRLT